MRLIFLLLLTTSCAGIKQKPAFDTFIEVSNENSADSQSIHFQNGNQHIFYSLIMPGLESNEADRLFQNRVNYLKSLYQNDKDPYFGKTSRSDECLRGINLENQKMSDSIADSVSFTLPSTDNFVLGQCNPELESYEARITFIYCKKAKRFYELKYYKPKLDISLMKTKAGYFCED